MDATQSTTTKQMSKDLFKRAERSDLLLRIEFHFDGLPVIHGTTDNAAFGGLFAQCPDKPCLGMVGRVGLCRVFLGMDYLEFPCRVMRVLDNGLGIHLLEGYDEEYNMVMGHMQQGETEMGLDVNGEVAIGVHSQMIGEIHPYH